MGHFGKLLNLRKELWEPLMYSYVVKITGSQDFWMVFEVGQSVVLSSLTFRI